MHTPPPRIIIGLDVSVHAGAWIEAQLWDGLKLRRLPERITKEPGRLQYQLRAGPHPHGKERINPGPPTNSHQSHGMEVRVF